MLKGKRLEDICESDLVELIDLTPEGIILDYKQEMYGRSDEGVKECLKDVSSFANTAGGHLIIGMAEEEGIASAIHPIRTDIDQEVQRLENLIRDGIEPRITGIGIKAVRLSDGGWVIVVRIPRGWNAPYRVCARKTNRFFGRNSAGAYELSLSELRGLFTAAASIQDRCRAFRRERLTAIQSGNSPTPLLQLPGTRSSSGPLFSIYGLSRHRSCCCNESA